MHDDGTPHAHPHAKDPATTREREQDRGVSRADHANADEREEAAGDANPPRTTKDGITAPKFGSAGSGGAELEPGPKKN